MNKQQPKFEFTNCPLCASSHSGFYLATPDRFDLQSRRLYNLVRCSDCAFVYLNPRPLEEQSGVFYKYAEYSPHLTGNRQLSLQEKLYVRLRDFNNRNKRKFIEKEKSQRTKVLDIGCGTGEFLQEMQNAGWHVHGVERDPDAAGAARDEKNLAVTKGTLADLPLNTTTFEVITLWHVFEHIYQPVTEIERIRARLTDDGVLVIAVPNCAGLDAAFYRQNWIAWDTPRHVNHFHLKSLQKFMELHKFILIKKSSLALDSFFNALMSEQLVNQCSRASRGTKTLRLLRAGLIGGCSFFAGWFSPFLEQSRGASLLTMWQKY